MTTLLLAGDKSFKIYRETRLIIGSSIVTYVMMRFFCAQMASNLDEWIKEGPQFNDILMSLEYMKFNIRSFARKYSIAKSKGLKQEKRIELQLSRLKLLLEAEGDKHLEDYMKVEDEYEEHLLSKQKRVNMFTL